MMPAKQANDAHQLGIVWQGYSPKIQFQSVSQTKPILANKRKVTPENYA